jgi:release factor glutamine methyltransferase
LVPAKPQQAQKANSEYRISNPEGRNSIDVNYSKRQSAALPPFEILSASGGDILRFYGSLLNSGSAIKSMSGENRNTATNSQWTIIKLLQWAASYFKTHDIDSPRATGEILLAHALKCERIDLYLKFDQPLLGDELKRFKVLVQRRIRREPVAYILGVKEFWSLDLEVTEDVLIPRPETECLVEAALALLPRQESSQSWRILELGTGSGAIAIALASQLPRHIYFASDRSMPAVKVARRNARRHNLGDMIHYFNADWLTSINRKTTAFDMIVSNPPYIPSRVIGELQPEIHGYEPMAALDGDHDGLGCISTIIGSAHHHLHPGGVLLLEIGHDQQGPVRRMAIDSGRYDSIGGRKDYAGHDRVIWMHKKD